MRLYIVCLVVLLGIADLTAQIDMLTEFASNIHISILQEKELLLVEFVDENHGLHCDSIWVVNKYGDIRNVDVQRLEKVRSGFGVPTNQFYYYTQNNKKGLMNGDYEVVLEAAYDQLKFLNPGVLSATRNDQKMIINTANEKVLSLKSKRNGETYYDENHFFTRIAGEYQLYKNDGTLVKTSKTRFCSKHFSHIDEFRTKMDDKCKFGLVDSNENIIIPFKYSKIYRAKENIVILNKDKQNWAYHLRNGKTIDLGASRLLTVVENIMKFGSNGTANIIKPDGTLLYKKPKHEIYAGYNGHHFVVENDDDKIIKHCDAEGKIIKEHSLEFDTDFIYYSRKLHPCYVFLKNPKEPILYGESGNQLFGPEDKLRRVNSVDNKFICLQKLDGQTMIINPKGEIIKKDLTSCLHYISPGRYRMVDWDNKTQTLLNENLEVLKDDIINDFGTLDYLESLNIFYVIDKNGAELLDYDGNKILSVEKGNFFDIKGFDQILKIRRNGEWALGILKK